MTQHTRHPGRRQFWERIGVRNTQNPTLGHYLCEAIDENNRILYDRKSLHQA